MGKISSIKQKEIKLKFMINVKNKRVWIVFLSFYILGVLSSYIIEEYNSTSAQQSLNKNIVEKYSMNNSRLLNHKDLSISLKSDEDISAYIKKINRAKSISDFQALYEEARMYMERDQFYVEIPSHSRMLLLMRRWGEIAPRQAIEYINFTGGSKKWVSLIFLGWAAVDPENAVLYLEENQMNPHIKNNSDIIVNIMKSWGEHAPDNAWEWLKNQKGKMISQASDDTYAQYCLLESIIKYHPKKANEFFEKLKNEGRGFDVYALSLNLAEDTAHFNEIIRDLSAEEKIKMESGKVMKLSRGNLDQLKEKLNQYTPEFRKKIISIIASDVLKSNNLDTRERIEWLWNEYPIESILGTSLQIEQWMWNDMKNAKAWINTLPNDERKKRLETVYKEKKQLWEYIVNEVYEKK